MSDPKGAFERAKFYDCRGSEVFTCKTPQEALIEYLGGSARLDEDRVALIVRRSPITMSAFVPRSIDGPWISNRAWGLLEEAADRFSEEFGDPDGGDDGLDENAYQAEMPAAVEVLTIFYGHGRVYSCEKVAERVYDAAEVECILRERCPEWFAEQKRGTP